MKEQKTVFHNLEAQGYMCRIVSIRRLKDLRDTIEGLNAKGLLERDLYEQYFSKFQSGPPPEMPGARSLIVMARRDPMIRFTFHKGGKTVQALVPPTYLHGQKKIDHARSVLSGLLKPLGHSVLKVTVPNKLLAVCSGLAEYGKNNISYIRGMGSFHRIVAFCSDLQCDSDVWREPVMMEECKKCEKCMRSCPAGAILADRFLLNVERCITFWNEKDLDVEFPDWLKPSWHNCLVGCMICQRSCPVNREFLDRHETGADFSEEETQMLLKGTPLAEMPQVLQDKLHQADLAGIAELLPRNLRALLG
jgi:epoxyqueuosine reductase